MPKNKRKLTAAEKAEKKRQRALYMTIFINGKMKRLLRPPTIDGVALDDFIRENADPIWLHQNEMWEDMPVEFEDRVDHSGAHSDFGPSEADVEPDDDLASGEGAAPKDGDALGDDEIPF